MNCCDCSSVIQHNDVSLKLTNELKQIIGIYVVFEIIGLILFGRDELINKLFVFVFLLLTVNTLHYVFGIISMFFVMVGMFLEIMKMLLIVQNVILGLSIRINMMVIIMDIMEIILCIIIVKVTFNAYREYKAIFLEQGLDIHNYNRLNDNEYEMNNNNKNYIPFSGKGTILG